MRAEDAQGARKVYYRRGSIDSLCAAAVAYLALGSSATYLALGPKDVEVRLQGGTELGSEATVIGLCPARGDMNALARRCSSLLCIDSSAAARVKYRRGGGSRLYWMLVSEQSAANSVLAWRHFMGTSARRDPPPVALQEISRLVAGQRLTNLGWALMTRLQSKEWNVAEVAKLISASVEDLAPMLVTQQAVVERSKSLCAALSGSSWETKLGGMRVRAVRAPKELTAAVAQRIADLHDGVVGMSYHEDGTGTVSASLAGREDVHVEGLASAYGGTGTGATGEFEFDESLLDRLARGELRSLDVHRERAIRLMGHCAGLAAGGTEADVLRQPGHVLSVQQSDWSRGRALARAPRLADLGLSSVS